MQVRTLLLVLLSLVVTSYATVCGYLFVEQRQFIYFPDNIVLDGPPVGSGYKRLDVHEPGLGLLKAWWIPPASRALPTIVFFHGNASSRLDFLTLGARFRTHGWGVVLASYRGYSGNPGVPTEEGLMADARATLAATAPRVGPVIVWGHSLGSGIAAQMASEGRAEGLVLESPYTALPDVAAHFYPYFPVRILMRDRFDTLALVRHIRVPVLIFHSTDDPQIPFSMGRTLADRFGGQATFIKLDGLGHYPHQVDLSPTVLHWAKIHCIGGCTP